MACKPLAAILVGAPASIRVGVNDGLEIGSGWREAYAVTAVLGLALVLPSLRGIAESYLEPRPDHQVWPTYAGAVVLAAHEGVVVQRFAVGDAVRYSSVGAPPLRVGTELPESEQIPTRVDTIYDLASISKLFTSMAAMPRTNIWSIHGVK